MFTKIRKGLQWNHIHRKLESYPLWIYNSKRNDHDHDTYTLITSIETKKSVPWMNMCSICLEDWKDGCQLRRLSCHHEFCKDCIDSWILRTHSKNTFVCPLCKKSISLSFSSYESFC